MSKEIRNCASNSLGNAVQNYTKSSLVSIGLFWYHLGTYPRHIFRRFLILFYAPYQYLYMAPEKNQKID